MSKKSPQPTSNVSQQVFNTLLLDILILDASTMHYVMANEVFLENSGYSLKEIQQKTPADICVDCNLDDISRYSQLLISNPDIEKFSFEQKMQRKDGSFYSVDMLIQEIEYDHQPALLIFMVDAGEKKKANRQLDAVINGGAIGYWDMNLVTGETYRNDKWLEMMGLVRSEMPSDARFNWDKVHPEDVDFIQQCFKNLVEGGEPMGAEFRAMHREGHWVWLYATGRVIESDPETKKPLRICGTGLDITSRKKAELEKDQFFHFFQGSLDVMIICDLKGKIEKANPAFSQVLGYTSQEAESLELFNLGHPDEINETMQEILRHSATQSPVTLENRFRHKNGNYLWFNWTISPGVSGKCGYVIARDITEKKNNLDALKENENKYRALAENSRDIIVQLDRDHRHIYVNQAVTLFHNFGPDYVLGKTLEEIGFPEEVCNLNRNMVDNVFSTGEPQMSFFDAYSDKGGFSNIDLRIFPIKNTDGEVTSVFSVSRDISQYKKLEAERLKNQKLQSLGVLAGGIAHDFNNILTILFGNIGIVKDRIQDDEESIAFLEKAETAFHRATRLTNQLLTFAKGGDPVISNINITNVIKDIAKFDLAGSNIQLEINSADNLWQAKVDKSQISQVFSNLITNAKQSMPNGGKLNINAENHQVRQTATNNSSSLKPGSYIKYTIRDEGTGISNNDLKKIFDPYFSTKEGGRGLGLATVHSIIKKHGGDISVTSTLNVGTTFTLYLPASDANAQNNTTTRKNQESPVIWENMRILVMDDEEMICNLASNILSMENFEVDTASNGEEAISKFLCAREEGRPYSCVIMDLTIPDGMGGDEAVGEILKIDPDATIIVSSGYAENPVLANFADYGFKGMIAKPFTIKSLKAEVKKLLS